MTREQTMVAASEFEVSGAMPDRYGCGELAAAPEGQVLKRLMDPLALAKQIRALGLESRAYGDWGGAGGRTSVRLANSVLQRFSRIGMSANEYFRVGAVKSR